MNTHELQTSPHPPRHDDDGLYQEGAARIAGFQRRVEIDEHSAQGDDLDSARAALGSAALGLAVVAGIVVLALLACALLAP